jgi:DNA modification methylase
MEVATPLGSSNRNKGKPWPADAVERRSIDSLIPYAKNSRTHSDEQVAQIAASMKEWGWTNPILIDETGSIIAGHGRVLAARKLGYTEAPVMITEGWTPAQKAAYVIADNKLALNAGWDFDLLKLELGELESEGFALELTGFSADELKNLLIEETTGLTDEDAVPEVPETPVTVLGDVWILGNHRLMCGDSTSIDAVDTLMAGDKASLVVTDPPWNVAYGKNPAAKKGYEPKDRQILNDNFKTDDEWTDFLTGVVSCITAVTLPGCPLYCVMGPSEWPAIDKALRDGGFHWSSTIIWAKDQLVMSRKDCHTQYEPIWYGWNDRAARLWTVQDRKQSDLWECKRPKSSPLHPTTKPVELIERAVLNSSNAGAIVFEPFGGSGSLLIACEKNGRHSRNMELDPKYTDVILQRWADFTGKDPVREDGAKWSDLVKDKN